MVSSLRVDDPEPRYAEVRLFSDLPLHDRAFVRDDGGWVLRLPRLRLARLEYLLEVCDLDGATHLVRDPGNPRHAPGPFGAKSVVWAPSYQPPSWLDEPPLASARSEIEVRVLGRELTIPIWSPGEGELPLLVAHDGPEYDALASLTRYAGAVIERGAVAPFRIALLPPGDRNEWYSASATYARSLCTRIVPAVRTEVAVAGRPVGIGASLGALSMLHAQRSWPGTFAGLFLQSGSFFVSRYDGHESGFQRYARVTRFVSRVLRTHQWAEPVPTVITCGAEEENVHNNRLMAAALAAQGYPTTMHEVPDLHNFTSWRDSFDPWLTGLLARLWPRA
jgi:enterochelin esterase-like enzyme